MSAVQPSGEEEPKKQSKPKKKVCICRALHSKEHFYLKCLKCRNEFHPTCVSHWEQKSNDAFVCCQCQFSAEKEQLYCICKTPYDEASDYVSCDTCGDWFHVKCIGITVEDAKEMLEYICAECKQE